MLTDLVLSGVGVPPYSARGLNQTLSLARAATGSQHRTVSGKLVDFSDEAFQKYATVITGSQQHQPPAVNGVWPGQVIDVDCIVEIAVAGTFEEPSEEPSSEEPSSEAPSEQLFARPYVPGSVRHESGFTFYRPRLRFMVLDLNINLDDWDRYVGWTLRAEEV